LIDKVSGRTEMDKAQRVVGLACAVLKAMSYSL